MDKRTTAGMSSIEMPDQVAVGGLDIIGDVHGCATPLKDLLELMGYTVDPATKAYRHPERRAVFVGDLIDRGEGQLQVLELVKAMVDAGNAYVVMGNHEFNAIAYATRNKNDRRTFLRPHKPKNKKQHRAFLKQLDARQRAFWVDWFMTLPLWLDVDDIGVRVVHACWHEESMKTVEKACGSNRLSLEHFEAATRKGDPLYEAIEVLLKGPEISLKKYGQQSFRDHEMHERAQARVMWWKSDAATLRELADVRGAKKDNGDPYPTLPDLVVDFEDGPTYAYTDGIPLFYGHYWRQWEKRQEDWTDHTACVDFSAVRGGTLVAYRWNGEPAISWENYVPDDSEVVAHSSSA